MRLPPKTIILPYKKEDVLSGNHVQLEDCLHKVFAEIERMYSELSVPLLGGPAGSPGVWSAEQSMGAKLVSHTAQIVAPTVDCATGDGKYYYRIPTELNMLYLTHVAATVVNPGAGVGTKLSIQINNVTRGLDLLYTPLTIDTLETDSLTAAAPAVIRTILSQVVTGDVLRVDVDEVHADPSQGLIIELQFGTVAPSHFPTFSRTYYPAAQADDGYGYTGTPAQFFASSHIVLGGVSGVARKGFIRLPSVTVKKGATVTQATLTLFSEGTYNGSPEALVKVYCNDVDSSIVPTTYVELDTLVLTSGFHNWFIPVPTIYVGYSIDVTTIVQGIINRAGWASGNALTLVFTTAEANNYRTFLDQADASLKPKLVITGEEYT
jgi:hypothetical protein